MSNTSGGERIVFRDRVTELQQKLKKSEEERLRLEAQFEVMMIAAREEEAARLLKLRGKYEKIVECEKRRRDRNDQILHTLDRIESRTAMIVAKSERLQLLRRHYEAYVTSLYPAWNANSFSQNGFGAPQIKPVPQFDHHPPRNGARLPNLQKDPLLFPLNPVKGAYISPHASQKAYDLSPNTFHESLLTPSFEQNVPVKPQEFIPSPQYSHQSVPIINPPSLFTPLQHHLNVPYQQSSSSPKQSMHYPSPVTPNGDGPHVQSNYDVADETSKEYRRRNLFPDEPYALQERLATKIEGGVKSYFAGSGDNGIPRNEMTLELNDYMKKTAELLNYTMRDYGKEGTKLHDEEESRHGNSADFELEQNTSGDILNISLSDDGVMNQDESIGKNRDRNRDIPDIAYDIDDRFKPRRVVRVNGSPDSVNNRVAIKNKIGEGDTAANAVVNTSENAIMKREEFGQGDEPVPTPISQEKYALLEDDLKNQESQQTPVECILENGEVQDKFQKMQAESHEYDKNQDADVNNEVEDKELVNAPGSQEVREVDSGIGREYVDGYQPGQLEYQEENNLAESESSQYLDNQSENNHYKQERKVSEQYKVSEQLPVQDQPYEHSEYEAEQSQEHAEYSAAVDGVDDGTELNVAEQEYEQVDQGEYSAQEQPEYAQGEEGYVTQDQYGEQEYGDQYQAQYETGQEGLVPEEGGQYEGGEYQGQDGQYVGDENHGQAEDQGQYAADNQGEYIEGENQYVGDQSEYAEGHNQYVEGQNQYEEGQNQYVGGQNQYEEGQNQYEEGQNQYVEGQNQYEEGQNQYVEDQNQYEEGQNQYAEGQNQYGESQNQYEEGPTQYAGEENQFVEGQNQYAEDQSQYGVQDQEQYAPVGQDGAEGQQQYSTENQEGYDEAAYEEEQQQEQEYAEGTYEMGNEEAPGENQLQGEQSSEVYFDGGKYHEPTSGYERDETGGEYLQPGMEGETGNDMPESSQEQADLDESEYSVQEQDENYVGQEQEYVGENQEFNEDTSISSNIETDQKTSGLENKPLAAARPRKSGLAMLESDTESPVHLGNAGMSNDDSDFDFSSGK